MTDQANELTMTCRMCWGDGWYMAQDPGDIPYRHDPCDACDGKGRLPAKPCAMCKGTGTVEIEGLTDVCANCEGYGLIEKLTRDEMTAEEAETALVALREPVTMAQVERELLGQETPPQLEDLMPESEVIVTGHFWPTSAGMIKTTKQMRPRDPRDHYPTPPALARKAISLFPADYDHDNGRGVAIFDIGVGNGVWGQAAAARWPNARVNGCDIAPEVGKPDGYKSVFIEDIREHAPKHQRRYDIVVGNPPYGIMEACVRAGLSMLKPGGSMILLGRMAFLAGQERGFGIVHGKKKGLGLWEEYPPNRIIILSERPSFTGNSKTDATEYVLYEWVKGYYAPPMVYWHLWRDTP